MAKAVLSKTDLTYLAMINDPKAQNAARKTILERKEAALAKSGAAFKEYLGRRKAKLESDITVQVRQSKRGQKFIVVSGGGLLNDVWLSSKAAISILSVSTQIKAMVADVTPVVQTDKPETK